MVAVDVRAQALEILPQPLLHRVEPRVLGIVAGVDTALLEQVVLDRLEVSASMYRAASSQSAASPGSSAASSTARPASSARASVA